MNHSVIPPSSAGIWGKPNGCTGSVAMSAAFPETEENETAQEGTAVHELAARMIRNEPIDQSIPYTDEMWDSAKVYADDVKKVQQQCTVYAVTRVEQIVRAPRIHDKSFGTNDCNIYDPRYRKLYVWDFKNGRKIVEAFENWQAINYVAGIFDTLGININGIYDQDITVIIRIVQPRAFHKDGPIREWIVSGAALRTYFNGLKTKAHIVLGPNATTHSGSHCYECSARHACSSAIESGMQFLEVSGKPTPIEMSPEALGLQWATVKRGVEQLGFIESGLEAQIKSLIRSGKNVPGCRVEIDKGRERWKVDPDIVERLGELTGVELIKKQPITPNQARGLGMDSELVHMNSEIPNKGFKLLYDDGTEARRVFG